MSSNGNNPVHFDVIILGGGPAGLTAGIYLSRARHRTLILNEGTAGGQMVLTHEVANYPGVESISGYQLSSIMKRQAQNFGVTVKNNVKIKDINLENDIKSFTLADDSVYTSDAVIIATGGRSRTLGVPGEERLKGKGISYCATCDGDFFTGREIFVVGGGNSALEEAVSLTKYASKVTIVHQFDHFQAFEHAVKEAEDHPKISFIMESSIVSFNGSDSLESVDVKNLRSGEVINLNTNGVFVFIGYIPNTEILEGKLTMNVRGEIPVTQDMETNIPGVFAAGDCIEKKYRQITTSVGEGTIAALAASAWIRSKKQIYQNLPFS
jgi:thioredoxin reductase (NADPH)